MEVINCNTKNCEHNLNGICHAGVVLFDSNGVCTTRVKREDGMIGQMKANMEASKDFTPEDIETFVECNCTECQFNRNKCCGCEDIDVKDGLMKVKCNTKSV